MDIPARYRRAVTSRRGITSRVVRINPENANPVCDRSPPGYAPEILSFIIDRVMGYPIETRNRKKVVGCNIVSVEVGCVYSSLVQDRYSNRQKIREGQVSLRPADFA